MKRDAGKDRDTLRREGRWRELAAALEQEVATAADERDQLALLIELAEVHRDGNNNRLGAIRALEQAIGVAPADLAITERLVPLYEADKQWKKLVELRTLMLDLGEEGARLGHAVDIARTAAAHLPRAADGIAAWERVLALEPAHAEAIEALQGLYQREQRWDAIAALCQRQVELAADEAGQLEPLRKLRLLYTAKLPDPERAIEVCLQLLELEEDDTTLRTLRKLYTDSKAWRELEETYADRGQLDVLARTLETRVSHEGPEDQLYLLRRLGQIYHDYLGDRGRALRAFERAFELAPTEVGIAAALAALYDPEASPAPFVAAAALARKAVKSPRKWCEQTRRIADLCERKLHDTAAAFGYLLELVAVDWRNDATRAELERVAAVIGGWNAVVSSYGAICDSTLEQPGERHFLPLLAEIAHIQEVQLGHSDRALETNQRILERYGSEPDVLGALERLYVARGRWADVHGVYERQLAQATERGARRSVLEKMARLCEEQLADEHKAIVAYQLLIDEVGYDAPTIDALDRLCSASAAWAELAHSLAAALASADDTARHRMQYRLGEIHERLGDVASSAAYYRSVLAGGSYQAAALAAFERLYTVEGHRSAAAEALVPVYETAGEFGKLAEALEVLAEAEADAERRVALLIRIGDVCERQLGDLDRAFGACARALVEAPDHPDVIARLEGIAGATGGWAALAEAYRTVFALPLELSVQIDLRYRLGRICADRLGDTARATRCFRRVLDLRPNHAEARLALAELEARGPSSQPASAAGKLQPEPAAQWATVIAVRLQLATSDTNPDRRGHHYFEAGIAYRDRLARYDEALDCLEKALDEFFHESRLPIVNASVRAIQAIEAIHTAAQSWPALEQSYRRVIERVERRGGADLLLSMLWESLADLYRRRLSDEDAAANAFAQALVARERLASVPDVEIEVGGGR